jgi:peptidoglycan/LPS O-acetylase OafA/YrhL
VAGRLGLPVVSVAAGAVVTGLAKGNVPFVSRLFGWGLAVWIRQRSYGIYLYHYAIGPTFLDINAGVRVPLVLALTFAITELSWRFVEYPLLRRGRGIRGHVETTELAPALART